MSIYKKYKTELDAIDKYINNKYIYNLFYNYGFTIDNKFIELNSNINVYEACFISLLIDNYIKKYKKKDKLNILEIGLAYGTSALVILNQLINYKYSKGYDIVDPYQKTQWNSIGLQNIDTFLKSMNKKIKYKLHLDSSVTAIPKLKKTYDIIFIDGSHDEKIVILDLINSDKKLVVNGLMILDDVLHEGVKKAILSFIKKYKNYKRINGELIEEKKLYDKTAEKKSFFNPKTMFCLQKIF